MATLALSDHFLFHASAQSSLTITNYVVLFLIGILDFDFDFDGR